MGNVLDIDRGRNIVCHLVIACPAISKESCVINNTQLFCDISSKLNTAQPILSEFFVSV